MPKEPLINSESFSCVGKMPDRRTRSAGPVQIKAPIAGKTQSNRSSQSIRFAHGLGMVHAISHMIGAEYDTHHGLTNAIVLPAVLKFNAESITDKITPMCDAMNIREHSFDAFYRRVCDLLDQLDIPKNLADIGIPGDCAARIAEKAIQDSAAATNPRTATVAEIEPIVESAIRHGR
jgi:alcohol dehydrogenase class IV